MARVCLPKENRDALRNALRNGTLNISDLYKMTSSAERRSHFAKFVPEDQVNIVNAKFEQAMMSNQKAALKNWVISTTSKKDPIRKDLLKRVARNEKFLETAQTDEFMEDLVEQKLGIKVTQEETKKIITMKEAIDGAKVRIDPNSPNGSPSRMTYGLALDDFKQYIGDLKLKAERPTFKERLSPTLWKRDILDAALASKALIASMDLSYSLRQGIKALLNGNFKIWAKSFKTSLSAFGKEMVNDAPGLFKERNDAVMRAIRAEIFSRPNALNGKYTASKDGYNLGLLFEEAFPSAVPERIPLLGRVFKASQTAYEAGAMRMRADLADMFIANAEKNGLDMLDEVNATAFGHIVGSMTGRSGLGRFEPIGRPLNAAFFAPRFLMSNFHTLTQAIAVPGTKYGLNFDKAIAAVPEAKKIAAQTSLRIAGSIAAILTIAKAMNPDSVEEDPRSTKFGKVKVGDNMWVDITGGMSGLAVLGTRLLSGESKSATGKIIKGRENVFGQQTSLDTLEQFVEGKFSPGAAAIRDFLKGQDFAGNKPSAASMLGNMTIPISAQNITDDLSAGNDDFLLAAILEGLGLSVSRDAFGGYSKQWKSLNEKHGDEKYNDALKLLTKNFRNKMEKVEKTTRWKNMTQEERNKYIDKIKREETARIMRKYGIK
jgi:hypothetical protein